MGEDAASIVAKVLEGDTDAFGELVLEHQGAVRAMFAARLDDRHEADDLAQEVFLIAYAKLSQFDSTRSLRAWLRGIASNLLLNHYRRRREHARGGAEDICDILQARITRREERYGGDRIVAALQGCMRGLDEGARQLLEKRYAQELPLAQICAETKRKHSALTMALHRLRERLRDCIEKKLALEGGPV